MDHWKLAGFRRRLEAGEPLDLEEQRALLGSLVELDRTVRLPAEFHIRVHREGDGTRWSAHHPLLRLQATARHPSDALVRAAVELRRILQVEFHWPGEAADSREHDDVGDVPESTWETLSRTDPAAETVVALAGALQALEEARSEAHALRYGQSRHTLVHDPDATAAERAAARTDLRRRHAQALTAEGVEAADEEWRDDGFGPAERFGILLPTLVVGVVETRHRWTDDIPATGRHWRRTGIAVSRPVGGSPSSTPGTTTTTGLATPNTCGSPPSRSRRPRPPNWRSDGWRTPSAPARASASMPPTTKPFPGCCPRFPSGMCRAGSAQPPSRSTCRASTTWWSTRPT